jgi:hypothetical protein
MVRVRWKWFSTMRVCKSHTEKLATKMAQMMTIQNVAKIL